MPPLGSRAASTGTAVARAAAPSAATAVPATSAGAASGATAAAASPADAGLPSNPLVAKKDVNVGKLAGAIAARVRTEGVAPICAVGPEASYAAVKAIVLADKYLQETLQGKVLGIVLERVEVRDEETKVLDKVVVVLNVLPMAAITLKDEPEVYSSGNTNVGLMAGLMKGIIDKSGVVTVGGMGPKAVSSFLKAAVICQGYMADNDASNKQLALVPKMQEFQDGSEKKVRMLLGCTPVDK